MKEFFHKIICIFIFFTSFSQLSAQNLGSLKQQNKTLLVELDKLNSSLKNLKLEEQSVLEKIQLVTRRIKAREALINNLAKEKQLLSQEITKTVSENEKLKVEIKEQKERYSKLVFAAYKAQLNQSKIMFLLSSESFNQVYRRYKYMEQVSDYRKKQTIEIQAKSETLEQNLKALKIKEENLKIALKKQLKQAKLLELEKIEQQKLAKLFEKQKSSLEGKIQSKKKNQKLLAAKITSRINQIVRDKSNQNKGNKPVYNAKLMNSALAKSFQGNKNKLPWPVRGVVVEKFGKQPYPGLKGVYTYNNGVDIQAKKGSTVKTVFKGKISAILVNDSNLTKTVMIQHGGYFTIYKNLIKVKVSLGENVSSKQSIGIVNTDRRNRTILNFLIYKQTQKLNPASWLVGM